MGRLPEMFAGQKVTARIPYTLSGKITAQLAGAPATLVLSHNNDRTFEIHRFLPRPISVGATTGAGGLWDFLVQITDYTRQQPWFKDAAPIQAVMKSGLDETWELAQPYYLERSEGLTLDLRLNPNGSASLIPAMEFAFQGFLLSTLPATDRR